MVGFTKEARFVSNIVKVVLLVLVVAVSTIAVKGGEKLSDANNSNTEMIEEV